MLIDEIFGPTIQGEGAVIGVPTVFVRTGGCDYRCDWCDTLHAVLPEFKGNWKKMTPVEVFAEIEKLTNGKPILVTLSGGNPALHDDIEELIDIGHELGYTFSMETQGSKPKQWMLKLDSLVLSPKPPSSLMEVNWQELERCLGLNNNTSIKVVVFDGADLQWFEDHIYSKYKSKKILQVGNFDAGMAFAEGGEYTPPKSETETLLASLNWLAEEVLKRGWYDVRVLPQLHVLIWGNQRGV